MANKSIMGKSDIGKITNLNENPNISMDAKTSALKRALLARNLNTGRCTTPQELEQRFNLLFDECLKNGFVPTVEMLALCSGWDRRTLHDIEIGVSHKGDGMSDVIKEAKGFIATIDGCLASDNQMNSTVYIFRAKNYYRNDRQTRNRSKTNNWKRNSRKYTGDFKFNSTIKRNQRLIFKNRCFFIDFFEMIFSEKPYIFSVFWNVPRKTSKKFYPQPVDNFEILWIKCVYFLYFYTSSNINRTNVRIKNNALESNLRRFYILIYINIS